MYNIQRGNCPLDSLLWTMRTWFRHRFISVINRWFLFKRCIAGRTLICIDHLDNLYYNKPFGNSPFWPCHFESFLFGLIEHPIWLDWVLWKHTFGIWLHSQLEWSHRNGRTSKWNVWKDWLKFLLRWMNLAISVIVFVTESKKELIMPNVVFFTLASPDGRWMIQMSNLVEILVTMITEYPFLFLSTRGRLAHYALPVEVSMSSAQHLSRFHNHFYHMFIAMHFSCNNRIFIQSKDIHYDKYNSIRPTSK